MGIPTKELPAIPGVPTLVIEQYIPTENGPIINGLPLPLDQGVYEDMLAATSLSSEAHVCRMVNGVNVCCVGSNAEHSPLDFEGARELTGQERAFLALGESLLPSIEPPKGTGWEELISKPAQLPIFDARAERDARRQSNLDSYNGVNQRRKPDFGGGSRSGRH